jgi:hypothetical protein
MTRSAPTTRARRSLLRLLFGIRPHLNERHRCTDDNKVTLPSPGGTDTRAGVRWRSAVGARPSPSPESSTGGPSRRNAAAPGSDGPIRRPARRRLGCCSNEAALWRPRRDAIPGRIWNSPPGLGGGEPVALNLVASRRDRRARFRARRGVGTLTRR